jgi:hypothetical protein
MNIEEEGVHLQPSWTVPSPPLLPCGFFVIDPENHWPDVIAVMLVVDKVPERKEDGPGHTSPSISAPPCSYCSPAPGNWFDM